MHIKKIPQKKRKVHGFRMNQNCTCFSIFPFWKSVKQQVFVVQRFMFFSVIVVYLKLESPRISSFAKRFDERTEDSIGQRLLI